MEERENNFLTNYVLIGSILILPIVGNFILFNTRAHSSPSAHAPGSSMLK